MKNLVKFTILGLFVVALLGTFYYLWVKSGPEYEVYELVNCETKDIVRKTVATGKVNPRDEVKIVPQINGIVSELYKQAGQTVKKGDIIATIRVIPDVASLNSAERQVSDSKHSLELATLNFGRTEKLYSEGVATKEEYDQNRNSYLTACTALDAAENALEIVKEGVSRKYASYSNTSIRSTVSGMILSVPVKVGNSVIQANNFNEGTTIASVADMTDMLFVGNIDETEVGYAKIGMNLNVSVGAIKDSSFPAVLEYISPKSTEENGATLFEIKAAIKIPEGVFVRAGYSANADMILEDAENVLSIPESVLTNEDGKNCVYVYRGMSGKVQQFECRQVTTGLSDGIYVEITSGLDGNEQLRGSVVEQ